jgi:hypothetical protein
MHDAMSARNAGLIQQVCNWCMCSPDKPGVPVVEPGCAHIPRKRDAGIFENS